MRANQISNFGKLCFISACHGPIGAVAIGFSHVLGHKAASKATGSVDNDVKFSAHIHSTSIAIFWFTLGLKVGLFSSINHCRTKTSVNEFFTLAYHAIVLKYVFWSSP